MAIRSCYKRVFLPCALEIYFKHLSPTNSLQKYMDPATENHFLKESWYHNKVRTNPPLLHLPTIYLLVIQNLAVWGSAFNIVNWSLTIGVLPRPLNLPDKIFYYGCALVPILTLPFLIIYDWPRKRKVAYQVILTYTTWMYAWYTIVQM